jgi:hypothetical protein
MYGHSLNGEAMYRSVARLIDTWLFIVIRRNDMSLCLGLVVRLVTYGVLWQHKGRLFARETAAEVEDVGVGLRV